MHSCDNPICVNPKHLSWGTRTDNMQDARRKGRTRNKPFPKGDAHPRRRNPPRGSRNANSLLTESAVKRIYKARLAGRRSADIAAEYGVTESTINQVIYGRSWPHVIETIPGLTFAALRKAGRGSRGHKLTRKQVEQIRKLLSDRTPMKVIAAKFRISPATVHSIKHGSTWA
jgi:uncharacterized protein YjcR